MWLPDPEWESLPGGRGTSTVGIWRARARDRDWVVKRVSAPGPDEPGHWRREAAVAQAAVSSRGLIAPEVGRVEEDADGFTLWTEWVQREPVSALFVARALGRFAATRLPDVSWLARNTLAERLRHSEETGGWRSLSRTTVARLAEVLWSRRHGYLARYAELPQLAAHGDVVPANLLARRGDDVVTIDWASFGRAPAGGDLGYFSLSCKEDFSVLVEAYLGGLAEAGVSADRDDVAFAARLVAVYTVLSQAGWALSRERTGTPYLRALQRQLTQIEDLLD